LNKHNSPWFFEHELTRVLRLATTWKAIVLLDEADVFLEARGDDARDAANRNALVAVFLRHLEYFSGICFLTTNRIQVFDAAMKSRVHLALGYKEPDALARHSIWKQSLAARGLEVLEDESRRELSVEEASEKLCREQLNGREISNAIHTAGTLARYAEEKLAMRHIEEVLGVRRDFERTLEGMSGAVGGKNSVVG
jgi:SpoVK/Ycf46/Vps4 family AAA+-type ATPase